MKKLIVALTLLNLGLMANARQVVVVNGRSMNTSYANVVSNMRVNSVFPPNAPVNVTRNNAFTQYNQKGFIYTRPGAYNNINTQTINIQNQIRVRNF